MERKLGQTEQDFNRAKENCERMANSLIKKYKWIKVVRFLGNVDFKPGRSKAEAEQDVKKGKETSFGLNMEMTYLDMYMKEKKTEVMFRISTIFPL